MKQDKQTELLAELIELKKDESFLRMTGAWDMEMEQWQSKAKKYLEDKRERK